MSWPPPRPMPCIIFCIMCGFRAPPCTLACMHQVTATPALPSGINYPSPSKLPTYQPLCAVFWPAGFQHCALVVPCQGFGSPPGIAPPLHVWLPAMLDTCRAAVGRHGCVFASRCAVFWPGRQLLLLHGVRTRGWLPLAVHCPVVRLSAYAERTPSRRGRPWV